MTFLSWAIAPIYALHQVEEHGYDCFGHRYSFMAYFNSVTSKSLGITLNPREITIINVVLVWFGFPLSGFYAERFHDYIPAALCWGLATCNAIGAHILPMLLSGTYNPGAVQSLFMAPVGVYFLHEILCIHGPLAVAASLFFGSLVAHAGCILLPIKLIRDGVIPADVYILWMVAGMALPVAAAAPLRRLCPQRTLAGRKKRVA